MNVAIIGYGSIGQRHEKNCLSLGYNADVLSHHEGRKLTRDKYDLVIICSKTSEHLPDVHKLKSLSDNFLIEKPLAKTYIEAVDIKKFLSDKKVRVGYCLIFSPIIKKIKQFVENKTLGNIYFGKIYAGSYLPNWRAEENYSKSYSAKKREGGGVALDLIHEVNYTQYFFPQKITDVYSYQDKISSLEIDSSDIAFYAIRQKSRFLTITLNYFQLSPERYIRLVGEQGTLFADLISRKIEVFDQNDKSAHVKKFDSDYNDMYIDEILSMSKFIKGKEEQKEILSMDQAIKDLRLIEGKI